MPRTAEKFDAPLIISKQNASFCGREMLNYANSYLDRGDILNARSAVAEGLRMAAGPFYISVRDELQDLERLIDTIMYLN
jgi:hypothetical protein